MSVGARNGDGARENGLPPRAEYVSAAVAKRGLNQAMNLRELAAAYGYSYGKMLAISRQAGFPSVLGLVVAEDFDRWRREVVAQNQSTPADRPRRAGRRSHGSVLNRDLAAAWPHLTALLPGAGLMHG